MEKYLIQYNTGAGNCSAETLAEAKQLADDGATYTQQPIEIMSDGEPVAIRRWYGMKYQGNEDDYQENPITFGDFGFYADWDEA